MSSMINSTSKLTCFLLVCLLSFAAQNANAVSILQAKGKKVLISLDGENVSVGQAVSLKNSKDKVVAKGSITQAKGGKAIITLTAGKADGTETIVLESGGGGDEMADGGEVTESKKGVYRLNSSRFSGLLTMAMNNMNTKQSDGLNPTPNIEEVPLKGNSFGISGAMDYPFNNWLILRGTVGYEPFTVAGTSVNNVCNSATSKDCNANINYLSAGGFARINFTKSAAQLWGAGGATLKMPMGKTTTALKSDDIKMTMTFGVAGGLDYFISNKSFIPVSFEYQMFQSSETVSANLILLRGGYGWAF